METVYLNALLILQQRRGRVNPQVITYYILGRVFREGQRHGARWGVPVRVFASELVA